MCEQYVAVAAAPFRIDELWPFTERLERFGLAGFGWGATWLDVSGELRSHRDIGAFRDDAQREVVGREEARALLVHLRRPSKFSTIGIPDTQPFDDPAGRYAFSHNGDFKNDRALRGRYREAGRLLGKADTEVGARWLEDEWGSPSSPQPMPSTPAATDAAVSAAPTPSTRPTPSPPSMQPISPMPAAADASANAPALLARLHHTFGGHANLALLTREGAAHHYAGNDENPVFTFDLGAVRLACTGMYSLDRSLFKFVAPEATNRRIVPQRRTASL